MLEINTIELYTKTCLIIDGILQINAINLPFVRKDIVDVVQLTLLRA